ncbi:MAG: hypothetical protein ACSLEN_12330 [Candidatus Malihini olakiniferum]
MSEPLVAIGAVYDVLAMELENGLHALALNRMPSIRRSGLTRRSKRPNRLCAVARTLTSNRC